MFIIEEKVKCFDVDLINVGDIFEVFVGLEKKIIIAVKCEKHELCGQEIIVNKNPCACHVDVNSITSINRIYENI